MAAQKPAPRPSTTPALVVNENLYAMPPYDRDAELAVVAAILSEQEAGEAFTRLSGLRLKSEDFLNGEAQAIFTAEESVAARGDRCTIVSVAEEMRRRTLQSGADDPLPRLMQLWADWPTLMGIEASVAVVVRLAAYRRVLYVAQGIVSEAWRGGADPLTDIRRWTERLQACAPDEQQAARTMAELGVDYMEPWVDEILGARVMQGVPTGLTGLDRLLTNGGLPYGRLAIIAAATSMGKSTFGRVIGRNASFIYRADADRRFHVLHISCEQPAQEVWEEHMAALAGYDRAVRRQQLARGEEPDDAFAGRLEQAALTLRDWDSYKVVARPAMTASEIAFEVAKHKRSWDVDLVVFDYLQRVEGENGRDDERERIAHASRVFADVALQENVSFLCIAQDRRPPEAHKEEHEYRPMVGSIYGSSEAEKVASVQMALYRRGYYVERGMLDATNPYEDSVTEVILLKQTRGITGTARLQAYFNVGQMEDM